MSTKETGKEGPSPKHVRNDQKDDAIRELVKLVEPKAPAPAPKK